MEDLWVLVSSTLRLSTPIVIVALGGFFSERAGVVALGLEGLMLIGSFAAATLTYFTHDPYQGMAFAAVVSGTVALFYGLMAVKLHADQVVAGAGLNLLAMGLTPFVCKIIFEVTGSTPALPMEDRMTWEPHVLAWALVGLTAWVSFKTRWGLRHRVVGEYPAALDVAGGSVRSLRLESAFISGALAGVGGAVLATCLSSGFSRGMTAGRGFMALAALVFGGWRPIPTAATCLLFGLFDALQIRLQGVEIFEGVSLPVQWVQILPYFLTLGVLVGMGSRKKGARPPRSLGLPYLLFAGVFLTGCEQVNQAEQFISRFKSEWQMLQRVLSGGRGPVDSPSGVPSGNPGELVQLAEKSAAARSKANSEFLQELYRVVLLKDPESRSEFGNLVDTLNQGASIEGIYNGLIHSAKYRELEERNQGATPASIRIFAEEMVALQGMIPEADRTILNEKSARPLPAVSYPEYHEEKSSEKTPTPVASETPPILKELSSEQGAQMKSQIEKVFVGSSLYTLKRILGDEVLKVIAYQRAYPEILARWYGKFAVRSLDRKLDFGLELRNKGDEEFHRTWATRAPYDLIQWEALNRIHRILNETNRSP